MSCPWANIKKIEPSSLADIMSEEVARDLQAKEDEKYRIALDYDKQDEAGPAILYDTQVIEDIPDDVLKAISNDSVESDAIIAQLLQIQFDKEHDDVLKIKEQKFNGSSKVSISLDNFKRAPLNYDFESDSEEDEIEDLMERKNWDRFDVLRKEKASIPLRGYKVQANGEVITKHDLVNNGRMNACKLLLFPPDFQTGDGEDFDLKLTNKVYNSLRTYSKKEQFRRRKSEDKKEAQATAEFGLDKLTRLILYKLVNVNELLEKVNGTISIGKEAVILHAESNPDYPDIKLPNECAIKVFKTTLSEFKQREKYIKDDRRFKDRVGKQSSKKTVQIWAEKEMANLMRLKRVGIPCPEVVSLKRHILVMSFIGEHCQPAPKLKDAGLKMAELIFAYDQVVEFMKTLYNKANLVHADLSEYNILWFKDTCYFIDVSQSVEPSHENAFHFLMRDCCNVTNFFNKKNVPEVISPEALFEEIVGCDFRNKVALTALHESIKMKPHLVDNPNVQSTFIFDSVWEKIQHEKSLELVAIPGPSLVEIPPA
ncbi:hypothetical protein ABEB36_009952 [Hypothenemus hampei]|uniref:Serine/threonine-protein kinase RIO3 n=1 Tax=Hypothenemus hampei TaxID=57062 RepID=A0ABD1EI08_HYPHA